MERWSSAYALNVENYLRAGIAQSECDICDSDPIDVEIVFPDQSSNVLSSVQKFRSMKAITDSLLSHLPSVLLNIMSLNMI